MSTSATESLHIGCASVGDAMEFLDGGRDAIYDLINSGKLASSRVRGRRLIKWSELYRFAGLEEPVSEKRVNLFTVADAARWLTSCRDLVYRLIEDGSLKPIELGGHYRISSRSLHDLIDANVTEVKSGPP